MSSIKAEAIEAISKLPDTTDMDEIMYRLYVIDKIRKGQESARNEPMTAAEDLRKEVDTW